MNNKLNKEHRTISDNDSNSIKICRILCIFFLVYAHVNPGNHDWHTSAPSYLYQIGKIFSDTLGRASVPALSFLSGFLALNAYLRRGNFALYIKNRFRALIMPMLFWNCLIILLSLLIFCFYKIQTSFLQKLMSEPTLTAIVFSDRLLSIFHYNSVTPALNFLRDAFACSLILPLLIILLKRYGALALLLIWIIGMSYGFFPIIIRPHVLMFFSIGTYLAVHSDQFTPNWQTSTKLFLTISFAILTIHIASQINLLTPHQDVSKTVFRFIVTFIFFILAVSLSHTNIGKKIALLDFIAYPMFLAHTTILMILWGVWQICFGKNLNWPYLVFYLLAPFGSFGGAYIIYLTSKRMPVCLQKLMFGKTQ